MAADIRIARLVTPLVAETKGFTSGLGGALRVATTWAGAIKSVVIDKGLSMIIEGARRAGQAIFNMGKRFVGMVADAAPLEGIATAFEDMAGRVGLTLSALQVASRGTVGDFNLMKAANLALTGAGDDLGQAFGKSLPKLLEIARATAKATGQDVNFLFQSLVSGIKRTSPMLIDNTGLVLKLGEANASMASRVGATVEDLTAEQRQIAILEATLAAGEKMIGMFGSSQLTAAEKVAQFKTNIQNAKDQIALAFIPALNAILDAINPLVDKYGPKLIEWAQSAGSWLGEKLPGWIDKIPPAIEAAIDWIRVFPARMRSWRDRIVSIIVDTDWKQLAIDTFVKFKDTAIEAVTSIDWSAVAQNILTKIGEGFISGHDAIKAWVTDHIITPLSLFITETDWSAVATSLADKISGVWDEVKGFASEKIGDIFGATTTPAAGAETGGGLTSVLDKITGFVSGPGGTALSVIGAIIGLLTGIGAPIAIIIGLIKLLSVAWEENFGGIREFTSGVVADLDGWFSGIKTWVLDTVETIKIKFAEAAGALTPFVDAGKATWDWIKETAIPTLREWWAWFNEKILPVITELARVVTDHFLLSLQVVWDWIKETAIPLLAEWVDWFKLEILPALKELVSEGFTKFFDTLKIIWDWLSETGIPKLEELYKTFREKVLPVILDLVENYLKVMLDKAKILFTWIIKTAIPTLRRWGSAFRIGLLPHLKAVWERLKEFSETIGPKVSGAWDKIRRAGDRLRRVYEQHLKPALDRLSEALGISTEEGEGFWLVIGNIAGFLLEVGLESLINTVTVAVDGLVLAIDVVSVVVEGLVLNFSMWVDVIAQLIERINELSGMSIAEIFEELTGVEIPGWLEPGSPPPLATALRDIREQLQRMPDMQLKIGAVAAAAGAGDRSQGSQVVTMYGPRFEGVQNPGDLFTELGAVR